MARREDDDVAPRSSPPSTRSLTLAGGFALAAVATLAVFLTDNPQYLRVAVVAVAWAFVLATFAAGRRSTDRVAATARETALRRAYELELEREVAARREYELELENELRRETEESMRYELDALRGEIAALSGLRDEVARVSALRGDIAALTSLRDEVARVAALRDDIAALNSLRQELGQLSDLRADMGRLRAELTEQLSSEMLVERIVMRTQASRLPGEAARLEAPHRPLDGAARWTDDVPPRELTGGWPAVRLDEPLETQQFEQVRVERSGSRPPVPARHRGASWQPRDGEPAAEPRPWDASMPTPPWESPATGTSSAAPPPVPTSTFPAVTAPPPAFSPPPLRDEQGPHLWTSFARHEEGASHSRHASQEAAGTPPTAAFPKSPPTALSPVAPPPVALPVEPPPSPLEWLAARSLLDPPAAAPTAQRPAVPPSVRIDDRAGSRVALPEDEAPQPPEPAAQGNRLAEILAENGVTPATGGRRRRRYRDEDETDDVLARVLGRN
jgi:hypothetical protein